MRYFANVGTSASVDIVTRYEGWGGAKDGRWHSPAKSIHILLGRHAVGESLKGSIRIAQMRLLAESTVAGAPYRESFDEAETLPEGWNAQGPESAARLTAESPFDGARALRLERLETQLSAPVSVVGTPFPAAAGPWITGGALRSALHSPDNSFAARLEVEALDGSGAVLERLALVDQTGSANWKAFTRSIEFPQGTARARFALAFQKTHGWCEVDALSATPQPRQAQEKLVERIVIGNRVVGNLFLPDEDVVFDLDVQSLQPLPSDARRARVVVRDYWGAEQLAPIDVALAPAGLAGARHRHTAEIRIPRDTLETGKYYEVHVAVPLTGYQDAAEFSGFARLPEAESRRHPAAKIPFSIRNWDSRIPMYYKLASRLGIRQIGTWGDSGWEAIRDLGDLAPPRSAYLKDGAEGFATLAPGEVRDVRVAIASAAPQTLYRVRTSVADATGRRMTRERYAGGFATVVRASRPVAIDGVLDDPVWARAPAERIDGAAAVYRFKPGTPWRGPDDLSATWRAVWDAEALYLAVEVADDVHRVQFADASIWNQDGLQLLFDPARLHDEKSGKYDYSLGAGTRGPQAWCHLSAQSGVAEGEAPDIRIAVADLPETTGGKIYEIAIPWRHLAPFEPAPGANLGMNMILNEDDGNGRIGYSGWFSGAHSKDLDQVGDLVLSAE